MPRLETDMLTIILHDDSDQSVIEVMYDGIEVVDHIVIIHEAERWTDSPSIFAPATEAEQAEQIAAYRNEGYEDRNP